MKIARIYQKIASTELGRLGIAIQTYFNRYIMDFRCLTANFRIGGNIKFIANLIANSFGIILAEFEDIQSVNKKSAAILYALKNPTTYESTKSLFSAFLGVDILNITTIAPGKICIEIKEAPKIVAYPVVLKRLSNDKNLICYKGDDRKSTFIAISSTSKGYTENTSDFLTQFIPVGRTVEVIPFGSDKTCMVLTGNGVAAR